MNKNRNLWCLYFSELGISYVCKSSSAEKDPLSGFLPFEVGVMDKGYIKDPWQAKSKLKGIQKTLAFGKGIVRVVIGEENTLFKRIMIEKALLQELSISEYINDQLGKTIHFPFPSPHLDYHVYNETETTLGVLLFIFDEKLLHDYADLFESIGVKKVEFDVAYIATYRMYCHKLMKSSPVNLDKSHYPEGFYPKENGQMLVSLYQNIITIGIFDRETPVFTMLEELEEKRFLEMVVHYIERIANYYQYNINKGSQKISHVEIFNYCEHFVEESLKNELAQRLKDFNLGFFDFSRFAIQSESLCNKGCYMAYAASLKSEE